MQFDATDKYSREKSDAGRQLQHTDRLELYGALPANDKDSANSDKSDSIDFLPGSLAKLYGDDSAYSKHHECGAAVSRTQEAIGQPRHDASEHHKSERHHGHRGHSNQTGSEQPAPSPEQPAPSPEQPAPSPEQPALSPEQPAPGNPTGGDSTPPTNSQPVDVSHFRGVNIAGPEFDGSSQWPTTSELQYYHSKGLNDFRLPIAWNRFQTTPGGPLNQTELNNLSQVMKTAQSLGMSIMIDNHSYDRYGADQKASDPYSGQVVTDPNQLADFWGKMAKFVDSSPYGSAVSGFDLMNEPHDDNGNWPKNAQAAINAIRSAGSDKFIAVGGNNWDSGDPASLANLANLSDPLNKLVYEAHSYWNSDHSGNYKPGEEPSSANVGVNDIAPFVQWLKDNHKQGIVGEFQVPTNDPAWQQAENNFLQYLNQNGVGWTSWGGGQYWGQSSTSIDNSAIMPILEQNANAS